MQLISIIIIFITDITDATNDTFNETLKTCENDTKLGLWHT